LFLLFSSIYGSFRFIEASIAALNSESLETVDFDPSLAVIDKGYLTEYSVLLTVGLKRRTKTHKDTDNRCQHPP
jgi:hypothetical protein